MHKLPNRIRITSRIDYEVLVSNCINDEESFVFGECRHDEKQIVINPDQSKTEALKTLIHEALHAVSFEYDIDLTETQVSRLENGLWKVLKLNKLL